MATRVDHFVSALRSVSLRHFELERLDPRRQISMLELFYADIPTLDWWEPRYDHPWRRQNALIREVYGGGEFAKPKPPVEGPNNPDRLRRELESARQDLNEAENSAMLATEQRFSALGRIWSLEDRLGATNAS